MFSKSRIGSVVENLVWGIILGAIVCGWLLPLFGVVLPIWVGATAGGVLGTLYGLAPGDKDDSDGDSA